MQKKSFLHLTIYLRPGGWLLWPWSQQWLAYTHTIATSGSLPYRSNREMQFNWLKYFNKTISVSANVQSSVVTTIKLSPPPWWLATIKPTQRSRCFTVFSAVFWALFPAYHRSKCVPTRSSPAVIHFAITLFILSLRTFINQILLHILYLGRYTITPLYILYPTVTPTNF